MARYNEILVGRFARAVQKLFGMKGEVPVASLAGELVVAHSFLSGAENRYLEAWDRFGYANSVPAQGAGNLGGFRMRNPSGSNVIAVIEKISFGNGAAAADRGVLQIQSALADLGTIVAVQNQRLDSRARPSPSVIMSTGTAVSTGASVATGFAPVNSTYDFIQCEDQEITLLPGDTLQLINSAANQGPVFESIFWRERQLEESERQ